MTNRIRDLSIEVLPIDSLRLNARNPRTHSAAQILQIANSIQQFGFTNPILVDVDRGVIAGHGRILAAKLLGIYEVPTIRIDHLTTAQKRAYVIADNRLAENAGWDRELLALELQYLSELNLDFESTITGFEIPEIDLLIQKIDLGGNSDEGNRYSRSMNRHLGYPSWLITGLWAITICYALMLLKHNHLKRYWVCERHKWSLSIRPITFPLTGMSAGWERSSIENF
jgi:hypothetical protein